MANVTRNPTNYETALLLSSIGTPYLPPPPPPLSLLVRNRQCVNSCEIRRQLRRSLVQVECHGGEGRHVLPVTERGLDTICAQGHPHRRRHVCGLRPLTRSLACMLPRTPPPPRPSLATPLGLPVGSYRVRHLFLPNLVSVSTIDPPIFRRRRRGGGGGQLQNQESYPPLPPPPTLVLFPPVPFLVLPTYPGLPTRRLLLTFPGGTYRASWVAPSLSSATAAGSLPLPVFSALIPVPFLFCPPVPRRSSCSRPLYPVVLGITAHRLPPILCCRSFRPRLSPESLAHVIPSRIRCRCRLVS